MGEIVTAFGVCHSPHLLTRPPDEVPEQSEASIAAMRELGKLLDETKPDVILFLGSDHLETFDMRCVPTFAIIAGNRVHAEHHDFHYDLPNNRDMAEELLAKLIHADATRRGGEYRDAELGHHAGYDRCRSRRAASIHTDMASRPRIYAVPSRAPTHEPDDGDPGTLRRLQVQEPGIRVLQASAGQS